MKILMLLCCVSVPMLAQEASNQPSAAPTKATQEHQDQGGIEQRQTQDQSRLTTSPTATRRTEERITKKQDASNDGKQASSRNWWTIANTFLVTIFTGALAFLAHRQRQAMDRQAQYMRDGLALTRCSANAASLGAQAAQHSVEMARLEQRAWVGVHAVRDLVLRPQTPSTALVVIRNTGKTPARNITISTFFDAVAEVKTSWLVTGANEPGITLPPGAEFSISRATETALSQPVVNGINGGRLRLYFWGLIEYRIMDDSTHTAGFSFLYNPEVISFQRCAGFNDAD